MSQHKFQTIAPKSSGTPYTEEQLETQQDKPSRAVVQQACQRCRQKRLKCDGQQPCFRCQENSVDCRYRKKQRELIADLHAENKRLKEDNAAKDKIIETILSSHDIESCKIVIQNLKDGNKSRQDILKAMNSKNVESGYRVNNRVKGSIAIGPADPDITPATCRCCFRAVSPWDFPCRHVHIERSAEATATLSAPGLPTPVALPSPSIAEDVSQSQTHSWTALGFERTYVKQLIEALVTWDCLPFCILCIAPFMQAYDSGSSQYCSSSLVNALLALAIRVMVETGNEAGSPAHCSSSKQAFDNAEEHLTKCGRPSCLPDIQALGILSIYEMSCGRETEAHTLAQLFLSSITDLFDRRAQSDDQDEQFNLVRNTAYCGATSLVRMLRLACGQICDPPKPILVEDSVCLDQSLCIIESTGEGGADLAFDSSIYAHNSKLSSVQLIGAKIFQLTEWVYKILSALEARPTDVTIIDVMSVYTKCLNWYDNFFTLLEADGTNTPSTLFIHMYYNFCLLVLFRHFTGLMPHNSLVQPSEVCAQSVQAILSLTQSYEDIFTLQRISGFAPYFVLVSGLVSNVLEDNGSAMGTTYLGLTDDTAPETRSELSKKETIYGQFKSAHFLSHRNISAVDHARLLLDKMNSDHLVVILARKRLDNLVKT